MFHTQLGRMVDWLSNILPVVYLGPCLGWIMLDFGANEPIPCEFVSRSRPQVDQNYILLVLVWTREHLRMTVNDDGLKEKICCRDDGIDDQSYYVLASSMLSLV